MSRSTVESVFQVTSPFVVYKGRVPEVYAVDRLVPADDPILRTHGSYFEAVSKRMEQQAQQFTAPPARKPSPAVVSDEEKSHG